MENALTTWNASGMLNRLRLLCGDPRPVVTASRLPPPPPAPPGPMIMYDKGLPSLPYDILCEIFSLIDLKAMKSCSLTGKALSYSTKPFLHRTLLLTPKLGGPAKSNVPDRWNELEGLPILGKRDLLRYTHHISIALHLDPLFARGLEPHIQHLRTLTNLRSLKIRWLDAPSVIPKVEEYFGAFFGTLESLELEYPRGDHKQTFYFISQFRKLRDLRIDSIQGYTRSTRNCGPHFDIKTSPPLDGTLDLQLNMDTGLNNDSTGAQFILSNLLTLPSGLKFRTLKLLGCTGNNLQPLVDACAPTLECVDLTGEWLGSYNCPQLSFNRHPALRKLEIKLAEYANTEHTAGWLSKTFSTITSDVFTKLTVQITIVPLSPVTNENTVRSWSSVDVIFDQFSLCEDVTLVMKLQGRVDEDKYKELFEKYFPLMWGKRRVVIEVRHCYVQDALPRRIRRGGFF